MSAPLSAATAAPRTSLSIALLGRPAAASIAGAAAGPSCVSVRWRWATGR
jgi:hypothetical protein